LVQLWVNFGKSLFFPGKKTKKIGLLHSPFFNFPDKAPDSLGIAAITAWNDIKDKK